MDNEFDTAVDESEEQLKSDIAEAWLEVQDGKSYYWFNDELYWRLKDIGVSVFTAHILASNGLIV